MVWDDWLPFALFRLVSVTSLTSAPDRGSGGQMCVQPAVQQHSLLFGGCGAVQCSVPQRCAHGRQDGAERRKLLTSACWSSSDAGCPSLVAQNGCQNVHHVHAESMGAALRYHSGHSSQTRSRCFENSGDRRTGGNLTIEGSPLAVHHHRVVRC